MIKNCILMNFVLYSFSFEFLLIAFYIQYTFNLYVWLKHFLLCAVTIPEEPINTQSQIRQSYHSKFHPRYNIFLSIFAAYNWFYPNSIKAIIIYPVSVLEVHEAQGVDHYSYFTGCWLEEVSHLLLAATLISYPAKLR